MVGVPVAFGNASVAQPFLRVGPDRLDTVLLATKRFSARIDTGASIDPRRHASSHGAAQTRPQTEANGLGARATRYASSSRSSAMSWT